MAKVMISKYFSEHEAFWLPRWNRMANQSEIPDIVRNNVVKTAKTMDKIRELIGLPIIVTSWLRPPKYNQEIGGAPLSAHREGLAVDFQVMGMTADEVRKILLPHLTKLKIRMEDLPGSSWVHIDLRMPSGPNGRYFKP